MKILHINTFDIQGGAARAVYRLHQGLQKQGVKSLMLVQTKTSDDKFVIGPESKIKKGWARLRPTLDSSIVKLFPGGSTAIFSPAWLPFSDIQSKIEAISPKIVHLHWICNGMMRLENINKIKQSLVWTLHDMWSFTGGCHYDESCGRFQQNCGYCPQLKRQGKHDLSDTIFRRKEKAWRDIDITIVTPSHWLAKCASSSTLFQNRRIEVIHNGLDIDLFKPVDKPMAREIWKLPQNKRLILFGAMSATSDPRKGFDLFYKGIKQLPVQWKNDAELIVFGASKPDTPFDYGLPIHYLGYLYDEVSLALLYSAVDVMVVPSRQDNLPNTVVESLACGTPVIAFDIGGMSDMIEHQCNGFLAKAYDTNDLTTGIDWVLSDEQRYAQLSENARDTAVTRFALDKIAGQYLNLYQSILNS